LFCICSQAFAVPPNAFSKRIAISALMPALLVDDVVQGLARHAQDLRRTLDCQVQRLETFVFDDAAGVERLSSWALFCFLSLVVIDQRDVYSLSFLCVKRGLSHSSNLGDLTGWAQRKRTLIETAHCDV
jgi:hypothetical protein